MSDPTSITIQTPSRLHFGLLGWGPAAPRQFGGLGLMIDDPGLKLRVTPSREWSASGPLADRALEASKIIRDRLTASGRVVPPLQLEILSAPDAHVGLGVGTQLALAIARATCLLVGESDNHPGFLSTLTGRAVRSGIGLHGFLRGGFIIDGGRGPDSMYPPELVNVPFPDDWRVLVVVPQNSPGLHGPDEVLAFRTLPPVSDATTGRLSRAILLGVLPGLREHDLDAFGASLQDIQRTVGELFAPVQKGIYATSQAEQWVRTLTDLGLKGVGQSSWGPTVYGFLDAKNAAHVDLTQFRDVRAFWTKGNTGGAAVWQAGGSS